MKRLQFLIREIILEENSRLKFEKQLNDEIVKDSNLNGQLALYNKEISRYGNEEYDSISDLKKYDPDDYDMIIQRAKDRINYLSKLAKFGHEGVIVYRAMSIKNISHFEKQLHNGGAQVGFYWTVSRINAKPYWGDNDNVIIMTAEVPIETIDFPSTVKANLSHTLSNNENEITLIKNKKIFVKKMNDVEINNWNIT